MTRDDLIDVVECLGLLTMLAWAVAVFAGCTPAHQAVIDTTCDAARRVCVAIDSTCDVAATSGSEEP